MKISTQDLAFLFVFFLPDGVDGFFKLNVIFLHPLDIASVRERFLRIFISRLHLGIDELFVSVIEVISYKTREYKISCLLWWSVPAILFLPLADALEYRGK